MKETPQKDKYYEAIFKAHYKQLFHYALRLVNNAECAADITNDVFCYFWEKYDLLDTTTSPLPLLYALIRNQCVDFLRHKEVEQQNLTSIRLTDWYDHSLNEIVEHEQKINQLMKSIELLPLQTRKVFNECFLKGRKYKDVAEELQISVNTVKTHITRALQFLRKRTDNY